MLTEKQQIRHDLIISLIDKKGFDISSDYSYPFLRYVDELFKYILNGEDNACDVPDVDPEQQCEKSCYPSEPLLDKNEDAPSEAEVKPKENPWAPFKTEEDFNAVLAMFYRVYKESINTNDSLVGYNESCKIDIVNFLKCFPNKAVAEKWIEISENSEKNKITEQYKLDYFNKIYKYDPFLEKDRENKPDILITDPLARLYLSMYLPKKEAVVNNPLESIEETSIPEAIDRGAIRGKSEESLVVDDYLISNEKTNLSNIQSYEVSYKGSYDKPFFEIVSKNLFPIEGARMIKNAYQLTDFDFAAKQVIINHLISYFSRGVDSIFHGWLEECVTNNQWYDLNIEPHTVDQISKN